MIAVNLICGFLGAGKTTVINRLINSGQLPTGSVVMVNDFGEINIDAALIVSAGQKTIALSNGCLCCGIEDDLLQQLRQLAKAEAPPSHLLIEASGVADPNRVLHTLRYPEMRQWYRLDTVVCVADAQAFQSLDAELRVLAEAQLSAADLVLANKADCYSDEVLATFQEHSVLPGQQLLPSIYGELPAALLFDKPSSACMLDGTEEQSNVADLAIQRETWIAKKPCHAEQLRAALQALPETVFRAKGWVLLQDGWYLLQKVGARIALTAVDKVPVEHSTLVFITLNAGDYSPLSSFRSAMAGN